MSNNDARDENRLRQNVLYSAIYQILILIVPILTTPYVSRIFSPSEIGIYNLSLTIASFFVVIAQFGIETYGSRIIAKAEDTFQREKLFFEMLSIQLVTTLVTFILFNILFLGIFDVNYKTLYFVQSLLILNNFFDISWYFIGIEEIKKTIFRNALTRLFTTISILLFIKNENQLIQYALINVAGTLVGNMTMVFASFKYVNYRNFIFKPQLFHVKNSFKLLMPRVLDQSYTSLENSLLMLLSSATSVGIYTQAKKIVNLLFAIINSGINALSPRMSYYVSISENEKIKSVFDKGLEMSLNFSVIMVTGVFSVGNDFVLFFFGPDYLAVSTVLKICSLALIFITMNSLITRGILVPYNMDKEFIFSIIISLLTGLLFNITLVPYYASNGAGITYVLAQFFSFIYLLFISRKLIEINSVIKTLIIYSILIGFNLFIMSKIINIVHIDNPVFSFIILGVLSVLISSISLFFARLIRNKFDSLR